MIPSSRIKSAIYKNVSIAYIYCPLKIQSVYFIELQKCVVLGKKTLVLRNYIELQVTHFE